VSDFSQLETTKKVVVGEWIEAFARSHRGKVREENQDRFLLQDVSIWGEAGALIAMVADGMGGHQGGSHAAQIAVDTVYQSLTQSPPEVRLYEQLENSFFDADEAIRNKALQDPNLTTMGTTGVASVCFPGECVHLYTGDSRLYHFREGQLLYQTRDHSVVRYLQEEGLLTAEEARVHPMRSRLTSSLGGGVQEKRLVLEPRWSEEVDSHQQPSILNLQAGDIVLICSDGLCGEVSTDSLTEWVARHADDPEKLTAACVAGALEAGGRDNITVIAMLARSGPPPALSDK
jgi:serine/threonine protein phosphatase PrpC